MPRGVAPFLPARQRGSGCFGPQCSPLETIKTLLRSPSFPEPARGYLYLLIWPCWACSSFFYTWDLFPLSSGRSRM